MRSKKEAQGLDLENGILTTEEDILALRRNRVHILNFEEYLDFLESFDDADIAVLSRRKGPAGPERFEL
jgi:hypothetical protein